MKTLVDCGCEVRVRADGSGAEIDYCPLHAAAGEMRKALRGVLDTLDLPDSRTKVKHDVIRGFVRAAIANAERRSTETIFRLAAMDGEGA